jgi:hypothetical protein
LSSEEAEKIVFEANSFVGESDVIDNKIWIQYDNAEKETLMIK